MAPRPPNNAGHAPTQCRRLILFARYPAAGKVKTRLIPALDGEGAAALYRRLVLRTLRTALAACGRVQAALEVRFEGGSEEEMQQWLGDGCRYRRQGEGDLGQRMATAFEDSFQDGSQATVVIGSDCPALTVEILAAAFGLLETQSAVFGPATDGGYYLIGLRQSVTELFQGIVWSSRTVLAQSLQIVEQLGLKAAMLETLDDLDRPGDLAAWQRIVDTEEADLRRVSVIIPVLNEAGQIRATLGSVCAECPHEIIVVDGGSADATIAVARAAGATTVLRAAPGRSRQMNAGAARASGNVVLFLHADTLLPNGWSAIVSDTLRCSRVAAGAFRFRIAGSFAAKRIVEWAVQFRSHWFQKPFGDQALFLRRAVFEELGGFADLPIMEDYEFVLRLRRRGLILTVPAPATTSGRRWHRLGWIRTTLINRLMVVGFRIGVNPRRLARLYRGHNDSDRVSSEDAGFQAGGHSDA